MSDMVRAHSPVVVMCVASLGFVMGFGKAASAVPIVYQFSGGLNTSHASTGFAPGTPFTGTFTYDPLAEPGDVLGDSASYSRPFDPPYSGSPTMTFSIGGEEIKSSTSLGVISTDHPSSRINIVGMVSSAADGRLFRTELQLMDPVGLDYGSYGPTSIYNLTNFSEGLLNVTWAHDGHIETMFTGTILSLTGTPVPEPASSTLICMVAIGGLAYSRRRRARVA